MLWQGSVIHSLPYWMYIILYSYVLSLAVPFSFYHKLSYVFSSIDNSSVLAIMKVRLICGLLLTGNTIIGKFPLHLFMLMIAMTLWPTALNRSRNSRSMPLCLSSPHIYTMLEFLAECLVVCLLTAFLLTGGFANGK